MRLKIGGQCKRWLLLVKERSDYIVSFLFMRVAIFCDVEGRPLGNENELQ